jgi:quinolinate synthase
VLYYDVDNKSLDEGKKLKMSNNISREEMISEIKRMKKEKNAIILAHNYQIDDIQEIADLVGDSFRLSQEAADTDKDTIVFCGVHFMAESAKILSPNKKVLLPNADAGCPMADMIDSSELKKWREDNPGIPVVTYVNSSAEVKAYSDICCTSANAQKVIESVDAPKVMFAPDRNLADFISKQVTDKEIIKWDGFCITHERVEVSDVEKMRAEHPGVKLLAHPECNPAVVSLSDYVGSTSQIIKYARESEDKEFIIGTENGILHTLRNENPDKKFYLLSPCLECVNMKKTTLEDVYNALKYDRNVIEIDEDIRIKAYISLKRMLEIK